MVTIRRAKEFMEKYHLYGLGRCPETMLYYYIKSYVLSIVLRLTNLGLWGIMYYCKFVLVELAEAVDGRL